MSAALPNLAAKVEKETLNLSDGTTLQLGRSSGVGDNEWAETKRWLEDNPEEARRWEAYAKDAGQVRRHLVVSAFQEYYQEKLNYGDEQVGSKFAALEHHPDFAHIFEDIKRGGQASAMLHYYNEPLMMQLSKAVGGVPEETRDYVEKVQGTPITFHEACKRGNVKAVQDYISANGEGAVDEHDSKGITALGYAIGANRGAIVKLLVEKKADPFKVDTSGCSGLHYAAAYGRKELLEYLLSAGGNKDAKNTQGQTPLALATKNKQTAAVEFLKAKGASM